MKTLLIAILIAVVFWTGALVAHNELVFKGKSFGFESFADTYSVSIRSSNLLEINRNGNTVFTEPNFCELKHE